MPVLVDDALAPGSLRRLSQPRIDMGHGLLARPWRAEDATFLRQSFQDPVIQRFHVRRIDSDDEARAQSSYWLAPQARGNGVATRAVTAITTWSVGQVGLQRVGLAHSVTNVASCRVAELAGFVLEGTLRRYGLHVDGWHDMHLRARIAGDARPLPCC